MLSITTDDKGIKVIKHMRQYNGGSFPVYSLVVNSKKTDDTWVTGFVDCAFKKGVEVKNKSKIKINNAFFTCNESKEKTYVKIMITDFTVIEEGVDDVKVNSDGFMNIPEGNDEELPFN